MSEKDILSKAGEQTQDVPIPRDKAEELAQDNAPKSEQGTDGVSLGKFKDIQSLLKAYESLQSEFTRKCQRLADLEKKLASAADNESSPAPPERLLEDSGFVERYILSNQAICDRVLERYLKELIRSQAPATSSAARGMMPVAPPVRPRTIYEAGKLAEKMLKNL